MPDPLLSSWELTLRRAFRTGREQSIEIGLPTPLGERQYLVRVAPEFAADGSVQSVLSIPRDITERKQAEAQRAALLSELVERERRLQDLVSRMMLNHAEELRRAARAAEAEHLTCGNDRSSSSWPRG